MSTTFFASAQRPISRRACEEQSISLANVIFGWRVCFSAVMVERRFAKSCTQIRKMHEGKTKVRKSRQKYQATPREDRKSEKSPESIVRKCWYPADSQWATKFITSDSNWSDFWTKTRVAFASSLGCNLSLSLRVAICPWVKYFLRMRLNIRWDALRAFVTFTVQPKNAVFKKMYRD